MEPQETRRRLFASSRVRTLGAVAVLVVVLAVLSFGWGSAGEPASGQPTVADGAAGSCQQLRMDRLTLATLHHEDVYDIPDGHLVQGRALTLIAEHYGSASKAVGVPDDERHAMETVNDVLMQAADDLTQGGPASRIVRRIAITDEIVGHIAIWCATYLPNY